MSAIISKTPKQLTNRSILHPPTHRLAQIQRHLSTSLHPKSEIRDAYILSAARTPTGKV